jgi:GT2 family glycosyltransferase/glycosyltransferase involved in cell wall biosynthesis
MHDAQDGTDVLDDLARRVVCLAIEAPTDHLSDVASWHAHVPFAYALVSVQRPRLIVELGVHKGDSYLSFCRALKDHGIEGKAVGVDTWQGDPQAGFYDGDKILGALREKHDPKFAGFSTLIRKSFDDALDDIADGSVDLLHIDGLHTYDAVRHDFESWLPKLSDRGLVLFHDTNVRQDDFGVWQFWGEISKGRECYDFPYGNGLGVLAVGREPGQSISNLLRILRDDHRYSGLPVRELLARIGGFLENKGRADFYVAELDRVNQERLAERATAQSVIDKLRAEQEGERSVATAVIDKLRAAAHGEPLNLNLRARITRRVQCANRTSEGLEIHRLKSERQTTNAELKRLQAALASECTNAREEIFRLSRAAEGLRMEIEEMLSARRQLETVNDPTFVDAVSSNSRSLVERVKRKGRFGLSQARHTARIIGRRSIENMPISRNAKIRLKYTLLSVVGPLFGLVRGDGRPAPTIAIGNIPLKLSGRDYLALAASARGLARNLPTCSVSIIVPVYNQLSYTLKCIEAIKANTSEIDYEIIVVDDGSSDETKATLSAREDIVYLRNKKNLGFIGSCNAGAARAVKTYLCFLNNDTSVLPGWLSALVDTFEMHENVGLVGSKLIYPDGRLQEAGGLIWNDGSGWNWGRMEDPNEARFNYARNVDYCSGASIVLPRALFSALGGFDAHYSPAYGEDSDLCFKIRSLGLATIYQPLSQVVHFEGVTSGTDTSAGEKKHQIVNAQKLAARWKPVLPHQGQSGVDAGLVSDRGLVGRILVLDQITPEPDRDAGSITALEIMRALRDLGNKVTFAPCSNLCHISPYTEVLSALGIESVILPWAVSLDRHLMERGSTYDAVLIFRPNTWRDHIDAIRRYAPSAKLIYHTSDLHFVRATRAQMVGRGDGRAEEVQSNDLATEELSLISESDLCIVHSTVEQDLLGELRPDCRVVCFPWIYEQRGTGKPFDQRSGLFFVGGYRHLPNVDAVEYYVNHIHPRVKENLPSGTKFVAAGSSPPPSLQAFAGPDIEVLGYVEDISQPLFDARVMVVPLRYGAGIKGKILSAMAHGLPIVTTTVGAEGMGLVNGGDVLIADEPQEFAAAVERLYKSPDLWHKLQRAGLDYIAKTTSRRVGLKIMAGILDELDIPFIDREVPVSSGNNPALVAPIGSRVELSSIVRLAQAGQRSHPAFAATVDLLVLPDDVPVPKGVADTIAATATYTGLQTCPPNAKSVLVIADATDVKSLRTLSVQLRKFLPANASCVVVLAPPRLEGSSSGYRIFAPFSHWEVFETHTPFHEKFAEHFELPGRASKWYVDTSLTGFPAVTMVHISCASGDA